jgi:hypothetical protein
MRDEPDDRGDLRHALSETPTTISTSMHFNRPSISNSTKEARVQRGAPLVMMPLLFIVEIEVDGFALGRTRTSATLDAQAELEH